MKTQKQETILRYVWIIKKLQKDNKSITNQKSDQTSKPKIMSTHADELQRPHVTRKNI